MVPLIIEIVDLPSTPPTVGTLGSTGIGPYRWPYMGCGMSSNILVTYDPLHDIDILSLGLFRTGIVFSVSVPMVEGMKDNGMPVAKRHDRFIAVR